MNIKYNYFKNRQDKFNIPHKDYQTGLPINKWDKLEDLNLIKSVVKFGYGSWIQISECEEIWGEDSWKEIFKKVDKTPLMVVDEEKAKEYVSRFLEIRTNNLLLYFLELEDNIE